MLEPPPEDDTETLDRLASFLQDVALAWEAGDYEQRNRLARCLFEEIWVQDKKVVAVKPREEFEPFFRLNLDANEGAEENIELATPTGFRVSCAIHISLRGGLFDQGYPYRKRS